MKSDVTDRDRLHSIESASEFLGGVAEATLRVWLWRGRLTRVKVGRRTMIRQSELEALIKPERKNNDGTK